MHRLVRAREPRRWLAEFSASYGNPRGSGDEDDAVLEPPTLAWLLKRRNLPPDAVNEGAAAYDAELIKLREEIVKDALDVCKKHQRGSQMVRLK